MTCLKPLRIRWNGMRCLIIGAFALSALTIPGTSAAAPAITGVSPLGGQQMRVTVYSAAMNRPVPLWISRAADTSRPHPVLYLLNGIDGGENGGDWTGRTDVASFFSGKNVNVVVPLAGRASFYTDWQRDDPALGRNKWATFFTYELPPLLNSLLRTTGRTAVAGISMSGLSALDLAVQFPATYQAVGSYSGCTHTTDALVQTKIAAQLALFGADAANMWGPIGSPAWADHDPTLRAERLRGKAIYLSAGTGVPGPYETLGAPGIGGNPGVLLDRAAVGGGLEAIIRHCTEPLVNRLRTLAIPAAVDLRPVGTHAWPYWQDDLHASWPMFAAAIGA